jgi:hypothetical protein
VTGMRPPAAARTLAATGVIVLAVIAGACGSVSGAGRSAVGAGGSPATAPPTTVPTPTTATTVAHQVPTVPNCGGGAFEPKTLLIVCGSGTTMATGVSWRSWASSGAAGSGMVHLVVAGQATVAAATLTLDEVVVGPVGPQFSRLTVTWTGASPDGRPQDAYRLEMDG